MEVMEEAVVEDVAVDTEEAMAAFFQPFSLLFLVLYQKYFVFGKFLVK